MPGTKVLVMKVYGPVKKPARVKELDIYTRARNALIRSVRCLGERGLLVLLTQRGKPLQHVTASPEHNRTHRPRPASPVLFKHKMIT